MENLVKKNVLVPVMLSTLLFVSNLAGAAATNVDGKVDGALQSSAEAKIRASVTPLLNGMQIEKVTLSPKAGLYEILTPGGLLYSDQNGSFVIFGGTLVDPITKDNLTAKRMEELSKFEFSELPLADAIKTVRGNGSRVVATFEDPNCGFCKKLMAEMNKLDNVTVYTFLIPILSPDSNIKSKEIWCSADRSKTWMSYMTSNSPLPTKADCDTPIDRNLALSRKMHITGTPAILFQSNVRSPGVMPADQIELRLANAK